MHERYIVEREPGQAADPERELMVAVLEQAVNDLFDPKGSYIKKRQIRRDAYQWFLEQRSKDHNNRLWFYSFPSVCDYLNLDAKTIRVKLFKRYLANELPAKRNRHR